MMMWLSFVIAVAAFGAAIGDEDYSVRILHMNDFHSRFLPVKKRGGDCPRPNIKQKACYGGIARIKEFSDKLISEEEESTLFLNAGDAFQGHLWYSLLKWEVVANLTSYLSWTASSLGNHEFDDGLDDLQSFAENVPYPLLACNLETNRPDLQSLIKPYIIKTITSNGKSIRVAIIGYVTTHTKTSTQGGKTSDFEEEVSALQRTVKELKAKNAADIYIGLGHSGYEKDKEIAQKVDGLNVIVGGHTNTLLWNGTPLDNFRHVKGPYPTVVNKDDGQKALIVQTNGYGRFLGDLKVIFNDAHQIVSYEGQPHPLDTTIEEDPKVKSIVDSFRKDIDKKINIKIATSNVLLSGARPRCRLEECSLGSFIADAMAEALNTPAAILNSGAFKNSLQGQITTGNIISVLPYPNSIDLIEVKGSTLLKIIEHSFDGYDPNNLDPPGSFLQVSGLYATIDISKPSLERVVSLKIGQNPDEAQTVVDDEVYKVAMPSFLAVGGDGYSMIPAEKINHENLGFLDKDLLTAYVKKHSPISQLPSTGRIIITSSAQ